MDFRKIASRDKYITWFESEQWLGWEFTFEEASPPSAWRLDEKISESPKFADELDFQELGMSAEAHGVFVCSNISVPEQQAVVKIRMQIPFNNTASKPAEIRAEQACPGVPDTTEDEVTALQHMTNAGCSSTPRLIAWMHTVQDQDGWVPGGFLDYILMGRLPGKDVNGWPGRRSREERDCIRAAFKKAWMEIYALGWKQPEKGLHNLLWDPEKQKCYFVDWDQAYHLPPTKSAEEAWHDGVYKMWALDDPIPRTDIERSFWAKRGFKH